MHKGKHSILHKFKLSNLLKNLFERESTEIRIIENEVGWRGSPTNKLSHHISNRLDRRTNIKLQYSNTIAYYTCNQTNAPHD